jgi:hypothetical protein
MDTCTEEQTLLDRIDQIHKHIGMKARLRCAGAPLRRCALEAKQVPDYEEGADGSDRANNVRIAATTAANHGDERVDARHL